MNGFEVGVKPMEDGSYAVELINTDGYGIIPQSYFRWGDKKEISFAFDFAKVGLKVTWILRDV